MVVANVQKYFEQSPRKISNYNMIKLVRNTQITLTVTGGPKVECPANSPLVADTSQW